MANEMRDALNKNQANTVADKLALVRAGDLAANGKRRLENATVAANRLVLPDTAKAIRVHEAYVVAGAATGPVVVQTQVGVAPAANEVAVAPNGDIVFNAAEAPTAVDVEYESPDADLETFTDVNVVGSIATLPSGKRAWILVEAVITVGLDLRTINGTSIVARGSAPADNQAAMNDAGTGVVFNALDVVAGRATIRAYAWRPQNLTTKLDLAAV